MNKYVGMFFLLMFSSSATSKEESASDQEVLKDSVVQNEEGSSEGEECLPAAASREAGSCLAVEFDLVRKLGGNAYATWCQQYCDFVRDTVFNRHIPTAKIFVEHKPGGDAFHVTSNLYWSTDQGVFELLFSKPIALFTEDLEAQVAILLHGESPGDMPQGPQSWLVVNILSAFVAKAPTEYFLEKESKGHGASLYEAYECAKRTVKNLGKILKAHKLRDAEEVPFAQVVTPQVVPAEADEPSLETGVVIPIDPALAEYSYLSHVKGVLEAFVVFYKAQVESFYRKRQHAVVADETAV